MMKPSWEHILISEGALWVTWLNNPSRAHCLLQWWDQIAGVEWHCGKETPGMESVESGFSCEVGTQSCEGLHGWVLPEALKAQVSRTGFLKQNYPEMALSGKGSSSEGSDGEDAFWLMKEWGELTVQAPDPSTQLPQVPACQHPFPKVIHLPVCS